LWSVTTDSKLAELLGTGLPDFSRFFLVQCTKTGRKIYHIAVKPPNFLTIIQWPSNIKAFSVLGSQKHTRIGIFGIKIYHLATLVWNIEARL
jgi:hypothetical protein